TGKQNSINAPSEQGIATKPKWTPCQPSDERPQERALHNGPFGREPICSRDPGHPRIHKVPAQEGPSPPPDIDADKRAPMRDGMSGPDFRHVTTPAVKIVFTRQTDPHAPTVGRSFGHTRHVQKQRLFSRRGIVKL